MSRSVALALSTLCLVASTAAGASPEPVPPAAGSPGGTAGLLADLHQVPTAAGDGLVSWVDLRAVADARPGAAHPTAIDEVPAGLDAQDPAMGLWLAAMRGIASGSGDLLRGLLESGADWPAVMGFDPLAIDRDLAFGVPPSDGIVVAGTFDPDAIAAALGARGFTSQPAGGHTLWCGSAGCDGMRLDLRNREPADPFGGRLGRQQPLAVSRGDLLSSADEATVRAMLDAGSGAGPSLADDLRWSAAVGALGAEGLLIQATFVPASQLTLDPATVLLGDPSAESLDAWLEGLRAAGFRAMPPATLLAIGDAATADEQVVTLALTYPTLEDAQAAAAVLPERLTQMSSVRTLRPWSEVLAERGVTEVTAAASATASGEGVATLTLRAPLASAEPGDPGTPTASSRLYSLFVQAVAARDLGWLAPDLPVVG